MEIKQKELDKIIDKDDIVDLLCDRVESLPYNDFNYMGLYDLDSLQTDKFDFYVGLTNKQYLELLMLQYDIESIEIDKEHNRVGFWRENTIEKFCKSYKVEYDEEHKTYYVVYAVSDYKISYFNKSIINTVLYYASLVYEDFKK